MNADQSLAPGVPEWLPDRDQLRVVVSCTARRSGGGPRRLPERWDHEGSIAAVFVEDEADAVEVFQALDAEHRTIYVDVERKQPIDLVALATAHVRQARLLPHRPNDVTVRSLDSLVTWHFGLDVRALRAVVFGTGNLGFKAALMLVERGAAAVTVVGRSLDKAALNVAAIRSVRPVHSRTEVGFSDLAEVVALGDSAIDLVVTAVTAQAVVDVEWAPVMSAGGLLVDAGIDNLSPALVEAALHRRVAVLRLDTRAASSQLSAMAPGFAETVLGTGVVGGVPVVSGGIIGARGSVVVDRFAMPDRAFGVANGRGGLVHEPELSESEKGALDRVREHIRASQAVGGHRGECSSDPDHAASHGPDRHRGQGH